MMRAETLKVRQAVFVESSYLQGGSRLYVLFRHVLPNAYRSVLALAVLQLGYAIIIIAALAFLGYGSPPPAADWGLLISNGANYTNRAVARLLPRRRWSSSRCSQSTGSADGYATRTDRPPTGSRTARSPRSAADAAQRRGPHRSPTATRRWSTTSASRWGAARAWR